jgi:hypothetical protein
VDGRLGQTGFMMECYFVCMHVQVYDFLKGLQHKMMLITKIELLISILIGFMWGLES